VGGWQKREEGRQRLSPLTASTSATTTNRPPSNHGVNLVVDFMRKLINSHIQLLDDRSRPPIIEMH
jgi:hypothetical protein